MRHHAQAATAGSNHRPHTGARTPFALLPVCALVLLLALSSQAAASQQLKFKEVFGGATAPTFMNPTGLAVDQSNGDLLVMDKGAGTISRFKPDGTPDDFSALSTNVIEETPEGPLVFLAPTEQQIAVDNSGTATDGDIYVTSGTANVIYIFAQSGEYLGKLSEGGGHPFTEACGVAVDSSGAVYIGDYIGGQILKFSPTATPPVQNTDFASTFSKPNAPCTLAAGAGPTAGYLFPANFNNELYKQNATTGNIDFDAFKGTTTTETVAPDSGHVLVAHGREVTEFDASGGLKAVESTSLSVGSTVQGIAVGPSGETYVSREDEGSSELEVWAHVLTPTVTAGAATGVTSTEATLNGSINPEGLALTACKFEYGPTTGAGFQSEAPCSPPAAAIPANSTPQGVSAMATELQANTTYEFRLTATNSNGTTISEVVTFTTFGPPQITETRAHDANQSSAILEAMINPSGSGTSYRFEWGPTTSYGNSVPAEFEPFVGSGTEPVRVSAKISGLSAGTTYHYRVVATNSVDVTESPDQVFETLNSCGLPEGRCFELVSPQEVGPVGRPGLVVADLGVRFQATPEPGSLAYVIESGLPDSTTGAEVLYHGTRSASDWSSKQLSAPIIARSETSSNNSFSGVTYGLSPNLSCGFLVSNQPLTGDASTGLVREAGGSNLYRHNPDGSYTAISRLAPENLDAVSGFSIAEYRLVAMSDDCGKVIFNSEYRYPGVPSPGGQVKLYEWDEGALRSLSYVPGPSGETLVEPTIGVSGSGPGFENTINLVSADGSRVFFTAKRQTSPNPSEIGTNGIFIREDGTSTRDLSLSETSTPDEGATYQWATKDGSRVFFTANAGLTVASSPTGKDLYEYDLETDALTDLSVDHEAGGARVTDFISGSEDGSHVYFIAQGQLVPGKGKTLAQNQSDNTYSIYSEEDGVISYVATIGEGDLRATGVTLPQYRTSRVSPDGRYLLFESKASVTGYESGGANEAYLYDADASSEATVCVSCRQDGRESVEPPSNALLTSGVANPLYEPRSLVVRDGKPQVFFNSYDRLASGAVEGSGNVYEWSHGQIFHIATEPPGINGRPEEFDSLGPFTEFVDAAADGTDLYLATPASLNWEDKDGRYSVYDARIGGGFPEPPPPPAPCEPKSEGSCEGATSPAPVSTPTPSSSTFNGPGNAKPKAQHKKRHKRHHRKRKAGHAKHQRHANGNRRAGK